jgi:hypothetical protein
MGCLMSLSIHMKNNQYLIKKKLSHDVDKVINSVYICDNRVVKFINKKDIDIFEKIQGSDKIIKYKLNKKYKNIEMDKYIPLENMINDMSIPNIKSMALDIIDQLEYLHTDHKMVHGKVSPDHILFDKKSNKYYLIGFNRNQVDNLNNIIPSHYDSTYSSSTVNLVNNINKNCSHDFIGDFESLGYVMVRILYKRPLLWSNYKTDPLDKFNPTHINRQIYKMKINMINNSKRFIAHKFLINYFTYIKNTHFCPIVNHNIYRKIIINSKVNKYI